MRNEEINRPCTKRLTRKFNSTTDRAVIMKKIDSFVIDNRIV